MYEEVIANLEAVEAQSGNDLSEFVSLINKYAAMGLLIQVRNHVSGDDVTHSLLLTFKPSTSIEIKKLIQSDGTESDWEVLDLSDKYGRH